MGYIKTTRTSDMQGGQMKPCAGCRYFKEASYCAHGGGPSECLHPLVVREVMSPHYTHTYMEGDECSVMRAEKGKCGPRADLFTRKLSFIDKLMGG